MINDTNFIKSRREVLVAGDQCDEVPVTLEQKLPELSCFRADSRFEHAKLFGFLRILSGISFSRSRTNPITVEFGVLLT